jgi:tRNA threonylcarbamoyladenosine biosynthesis protein TsaB
LTQLILPMLILALDTTTRTGSIALLRDNMCLDVLIGDESRTHAERLPADILRLASRNGVALREVEVFAVASGPGSFTGLRIGIATIQGLAFASSRRVAPVSALDALAAIALRPSLQREPMLVAAWIDARRQEVFSALYGTGSADSVNAGGSGELLGGLNRLDEASVGDPDATLDRWAPLVAGQTVCFIGDGALRYRARLEERLGGTCQIVDPLPPLAPAVGAIAARMTARGLALLPHAVRPIYVRRPDAELARERHQARARARS